jgi:hypothetical protein
MIDLTIVDHGSIMLMRANTDAAREWIDNHIVCATHWCGSIVVEPRYIVDIVDGAHADGLIVDVYGGMQ